MRAIVMSTGLYEWKSWTMTAETERRIQAFEFKCLRRKLRISYTTQRTNKSVWEEVTKETGSQEHLLTTLKARKLRWFGHINWVY